jgi:hypothetical protein
MRGSVFVSNCVAYSILTRSVRCCKPDASRVVVRSKRDVQVTLR